MPTITLPKLEYRREALNGNTIVHVGQSISKIEVDIIEETERYILVSSKSNIEYKLFFPRTVVDNSKYALRLSTKIAGSQLTPNTKMKWENHPGDSWPDEPDDIYPLWADSVSLISDATHSKGFRLPQLGALHAVSAHWSVSNDPALIVLPTGTGKTETMMATTLYHKCQKVLVVVPTDPLRTQIFDKFSTLGCLKEIGCVLDTTPLPITAKIKKSLQTANDAQDLVNEANVFIATAAVLNNSTEEAKAELANGITHLFVDEAHHIKAPTWERLKEFFKEIPIVQFTATPFRNDGKKIEDKIIYNYPLGMAQNAQYFREIDLLTIDEIDDKKADKEIARKAVERLKEDLKQGYDHLILARTKTKDRAAEVLKAYEQVAPNFKPVMIHTDIKAKKRDEGLKLLKERKSRVLVCVNMFGEGFDMPNLKIAAMHDIHKTLPITLQFVGRFTRTSSNVGNASVVVNLDDPKADVEIQELYSQDANWNAIVRRASEERIADEIAMQEFINGFEGTLPDQLPLWNMRPGFSTLVFNVSNIVWTPKSLGNAFHNSIESWTAYSNDAEIAVAVITKQEDVSWGKYQNIKNHLWDLVIIHLDRENQRAYLHMSNYKVVNPDTIIKTVCGDDVSLLTGPNLFRVFSNVERPMIKNLGASKSGSISFTMYFGPEVSAGLSQVEKAESELNNLLGWGYEDGDKITLGCSHRRGKVWSRSGGSIKDWTNWCHMIGEKVFDENLPEAELIRDFLRPVQIFDRPNKYPISIEWGERLFGYNEDRINILFGTESEKLHHVELSIVNHELTGDLTFKVHTERFESTYKLVITEGKDTAPYRYEKVSGPDVSTRIGAGQLLTLEERMIRDPLIFMYGDGSFSYNNYLVEAPCRGQLDLNRIVPLDWTGVDIKSESQGKELKKDSIQYFICQKMIQEEDFDIIFDDDGKGEAADIIALRKEENESVTMVLVHCKFASDSTPRAVIDDFYQVCGQAQKSVKWKHRGIRELMDHMKRREGRWQEFDKSRFLKGNFSQVRLLERIARKSGLKLEVRIVQPGLSKGRVSSGIRDILGATEQYLMKTAEAKLDVFSSN